LRLFATGVDLQTSSTGWRVIGNSYNGNTVNIANSGSGNTVEGIGAKFTPNIVNQTRQINFVAFGN
jgi:hypothetical protein